MNRQRASAFSLIELSIVLVIVGLLIGGILAGKSLIRAAEIRSVATDLSRYSTAVNNFHDKYNALPGDMKNATVYWGSAGGTGANAACDAALTATSPAVCNGDGDGSIDSSYAGTVVLYNERFYAWKELANAGLVTGSYLGRSSIASGSPKGTPGVDLPVTKLPDATIGFAYVMSQTGSTEFFDGEYNFNTMIVWSANGSTSQALRPEEAWNLDGKFDDGRPGTGKVFAGKASGTWMPNCTTGDDGLTAEYNVNNANQLCDLWLALQ